MCLQNSVSTVINNSNQGRLSEVMSPVSDSLLKVRARASRNGVLDQKIQHYISFIAYVTYLTRLHDASDHHLR
jgi:hypothetical protein